MKSNSIRKKLGIPNGKDVSQLRYWETHGGGREAAEVLRDRYFDDLSKEAIVGVSREASIPSSAFRGAGSFYHDLGCRNKPACVRVCSGTSCVLNGAKRERENVKRSGHDCGSVYCLGHCDKSPVTLDDFTLEHAEIPTEIRCLAPHPIVTKRILEHSVADLDKALSVDVYASVPIALSHTPAELVDLVIASGERGRGGGGFSTGKKWKAAASVDSDRKYVIANGDEGDPGSFIDRVLMEEDPHTIIEAMILCGYAIGAEEGIIYIRSEYPHAVSIMDKAIKEAKKAGYLGVDICGSGIDFDIRIFVGMGSYVCGEETALIQSIEGFRGEVQIRPPYPTEVGLYGRPTIVNNVETLVNLPFIVRNGSDTYHEMGTHASCGTKAVCLNAGFANPGIVEVEYGITLREIIEEAGGGGRDGKALAAVFIGGPMGSIVQPKDWDLPLCYDVLERHGIQMGHAGFVAIPEDADFRALLEHSIEFSVHESCGKCAPCRLGTQYLLDALQEGKSRDDLLEITSAIEMGSLCAFGKFIPGPINTLIREFGDRIFES